MKAKLKAADSGSQFDQDARKKKIIFLFNT